MRPDALTYTEMKASARSATDGSFAARGSRRDRSDPGMTLTAEEEAPWRRLLRAAVNEELLHGVGLGYAYA